MVRRKNSRRRPEWLCALVLVVCVVGSAHAQIQTAEAASRPSRDAATDYVIAQDDVLDVYIVDVPDMSRAYRVSTTGVVVLPLVSKPITAAGLSLQQFSQAVEAQLKSDGLVSNPKVTVSVQQSRLHSVAVTGAVKMPQIYQVLGRTTLIDILSQAQGLTEDAGNIAVISRGDIGMAATDSTERAENVDITKLFQSGDPKYNVEIYPGDRVTVPRAGVVYVVGAVNKPGGFTIKQSSMGMTVLQALAFAADAKPTAKREKAVVIRPDPASPGGHTQVPMDLKKILSGKAPDEVLQANDILFIPDSQGKKALARTLETALNAASMAIVYHPPF